MYSLVNYAFNVSGSLSLKLIACAALGEQLTGGQRFESYPYNLLLDWANRWFEG